jgi:hypothetical protein
MFCLLSYATSKAWGIFSTDQSGHNYITPLFEVLDGDNQIPMNIMQMRVGQRRIISVEVLPL